MRDRARPAWIGLAGLLLALGAGPVPPGTDPTEFEKATRTILCDCGCHPQSVYDCACGRAQEMRDEIASLIRDGRSGEEVIASYVASRGEQIRIAPLARGFNLVAWVGPGVMFLAAAGGLVFVLRRWRNTAQGQAPRPASPELDPDDPYLARLRSELEKRP